MWDNLSPADIERAKQQLQLQRDEIVKRHAEELSVLDADRDEIDQLNRLIEAFLYSREEVPPPGPEIALEPEPAAAEQPAAAPAPPPALPSTGTTDRPAVVVRNPARRDYSGTNFDTFSKAVSKLL